MIAVDEKFRLCPAHARGDGRRVELVVDAPLALALLLQDVRSASLRKGLYTGGRLLA